MLPNNRPRPTLPVPAHRSAIGATREDTQLVAEVIRRKRIRAAMGDGFVVDDGRITRDPGGRVRAAVKGCRDGR